MLENNLVSLIAPFFNAESYLERFLKSVLSQTFTNVQFILVDDGSSDDSNLIVQKYSDSLKNKFKEFIYLKQKNGGAASAVNNALKYVNGEYLCWADCDDELLSENIEKKYVYLESNNDCNLVLCGAKAIDQQTGKELRDLIIPPEQRQNNMFIQIIDGIPVYPGVFMIRTQLLFNKLANREIYFNKEAGQNFQLILPVAYNSKCGFIDDILYLYYVRKDSHSHNTNYEKDYFRTYVKEDLLSSVLSFMPAEQREAILNKIHEKQERKRFNLSFIIHDTVKNNKSYNELKKISAISKKDKLKHFIINNKKLLSLYKLIN